MLRNIYIRLFRNRKQNFAVVMKYSTEADIELKPFKLHMLDKGPPPKAKLTRKDALYLYNEMQMLRIMERMTGALYSQKLIRGFCHLYSGQEAVVIGTKAVLRKNDCAITSYRCHAWAYVMGCPINQIFAELTGRQNGCARGKGGSMHMYFDHFYGGNAIVGAQVPVAVGIAHALKYQGIDGVCLALYGDGAANQGQVYEAFNIAKLWNLPCIFLCENNIFGMGTSIERSSASTKYYNRVDYIPGIWVDGMDVLSVREAMRIAVGHCVAGKGPFLVEAETYRYEGHSMSDPGTSYRTREDVKAVRKARDPIANFKNKIIAAKLVTDKEIKDMNKKIRVAVKKASDFAQKDKEIPVKELTADIYKDNLEKEVRNVTVFNPYQAFNVKR